MLIKRTSLIEDDSFLEGDIIKFPLKKNMFDIEAIAVRQMHDGMLFCTLNCLCKTYKMHFEYKKVSYKNSHLRKHLNNSVINQFPYNVAAKMIPFENQDLLRIPKEKEIIGMNLEGVVESSDVQFKPMVHFANRISYRDNRKGWPEAYWTMTPARNNKIGFVAIGMDADSIIHRPVSNLSIRLVFKLNGVPEGE